MFCSQCGTPAVPGAQFCASCGASLAGASPAAAGSVLTSTSAEAPARTGAAVPLGGTAQATSDLRDRSLVLWALAVIAAIVVVVLLAAHYG
ncbi:zinc ribbon domain-containing protein [Amycolatopsis sp.]|uniref:zinc ribbon domain-containing protein n=1 Tax=Amycolatopsis sp. TaxID=37632 RepID=UPI002B56BCB8|nr:zinc ribbon domain-containing protein [Amycolatopsis sp.]HVV13690.1 zinc ribbon domain-containing protein [Amycolatopsis sp.]HVW80404.1 zinc ribbon domain-containing protein [Mycobacteriales bacterium]